MSNTVKEKMLPLGMVFLLVGVVWQLGNDYGAGKATVLANTNAIVGNSTAIMRNSEAIERVSGQIEYVRDAMVRVEAKLGTRSGIKLGSQGRRIP